MNAETIEAAIQRTNGSGSRINTRSTAIHTNIRIIVIIMHMQDGHVQNKLPSSAQKFIRLFAAVVVVVVSCVVSCVVFCCNASARQLSLYLSLSFSLLPLSLSLPCWKLFRDVVALVH